MAEFGELVWYRPVDKNRDKNKVEARWEKGIWLGISRESNETLIGTSSGVIRCYAIKRMPAEEKWDKDAISTIRGTPQQPNPTKTGLHIPVRLGAETDLGGGASGATPEPEGGQEVPPVPETIPEPLVRRTPISQKEVENMDRHLDVLGVRLRVEVKLRVEGIRKMQKKNGRLDATR